MSLPRLSFLYPPRILKPYTSSAVLPPCKRYRHGTAVDPDPIPPPANSSEESIKLPPPDIGRNNVETTSDGIGEGSTVFEAGEKAKKAQNEAKQKDEEKAQDQKKNQKSDVDTVPPPPNISPRPYVHHFDTYSLVKRLEGDGGFNRGQSVAVMKGIRDLLTRNMDSAKDNLVSKSNVENESYLFQAACSELRNEIQNNRKEQVDSARAERTRIQQEFDSLNQSFLGEIMNLKDELNGMFNDRKMVTRAEQRAMENKIQELNYKITISMNSDLKSEIEKLRWVTTRRGLTAIALLAGLIIASIQMNKREHDEVKNKKEEEKQQSDHMVISPEKKNLSGLAENLTNGGGEEGVSSYESLG